MGKGLIMILGQLWSVRSHLHVTSTKDVHLIEEEVKVEKSLSLENVVDGQGSKYQSHELCQLFSLLI